jgi:hypothetical protein
MELLNALNAQHHRSNSLPPAWLSTPGLIRFASLTDVEDAIARLDDESDVVVEALLTRPLDDPLVTPVLLSGLRRLIYLCRGRDRDLVNDLVTEVAIAIGEMRRARPARSRRRLAYLIVDRARDRQRLALRRQFGMRLVDPSVVADMPSSVTAGVEESALDRVRVDDLRAQVAATGDRGLARSWNSLVDLVDAPRASQTDQDRWKYVRRRVARYLGPDAA